MAESSVFANPYQAGLEGPTEPKTALSRIEDVSRSTSVPSNVLMAIVEQTGAQDDEQRVAVAQRAAEQIGPRLQSGESIEDVIVGSATDEQTGRQFLERARMIGHEVYPDRVPEDPFEGEGVGSLLQRRGQQFIRGAVEPIASVPEAAAIAQSQASGGETPAHEREGYQQGEAIREGVENVTGEADWRDNSFWAKLAEGAGNMAGFAGAAIGGSLAGGPIGGVAAGAGAGAAMNTSAMYREALEHGADQDSADLAARWGAVIGASEVVPIARAFRILPRGVRNKIANGAGSRAGKIMETAGEEAAQEYLATVANNVVAQQIYDPERGWAEGATEGALIGGILGGGMGAIAGPDRPQQGGEDIPLDVAEEEGASGPLSLPAPAIVTPQPGREGERALPAPPAGSLSSAMQDAPREQGPENTSSTPAAPEAPAAPAAPSGGGSLSERASGQVKPPQAATQNDEPQTAEEARRRASIIADHAQQSGWNARLKETHDALLEMADGMDGGGLGDIARDVTPDTDIRSEPPNVPRNVEGPGQRPSLPEPEQRSGPALRTPPPGQGASGPAISMPPPEQMDAIGKKDGSPFGNAAAAKRGLRSRGLDPESFEIRDVEGGVYAYPQQETENARDGATLPDDNGGDVAPEPEVTEPTVAGQEPAAPVSEPADEVPAEAPAAGGAAEREIETKRDGSPFATQDTAWRALSNRGRALSDYEVVPEGDGFVARPTASPKTSSEIDEAAAEADPDPTPAQAEAGNYRKGHVRWKDMDLAIETPKGQTRRGTAPDGTEWSVEMPAHYGDIKGTRGADGDPLDVYLGDTPESDFHLVVNQVDPETGQFDEHKIVSGTESRADAERVYDAGFSDGSGPSRRGSATEMSTSELQEWISAGDTSQPTEPVTQSEPTTEVADSETPAASRAPREFWTSTDADTRRMMASEIGEAGDIADRDWSDLTQARKRRISKQYRANPQTWDGYQERGQADTAPVVEPNSAEPEVEESRPEPEDAAADAPVTEETASSVDAGVEPEGGGYGGSNRLVSQERAAELRDRLKAKLATQINSGIDPEIMSIGAELAVYHIEAGARRFGDLARAIAGDLDTTTDRIRPYLRSWYNGARDLMEDNGVSVDGMDSADEVAQIMRAGALNPDQESEVPDGGESGTVDDGSTGEPDDVDGDSGDAGDDGASAGESSADAPGETPGEVRESGREASERDGGAEPTVEGPGDGRDDAGTDPVGVDRRGDQPERREPGDTDQRRSRPVGSDHIVEAGDLEPSRGAKTRANQSIKAVKLLRELQAESRLPTEAERKTLARYGGAGTLAQALPDSSGKSRMPDILEQIEALFPVEARRTLDRTSQYAFYTAEPVVRGMWQLAERLGFSGGRVFEPGMGVGGFAGTIPESMKAGTEYTGLELDQVTAEIAQMLYPRSRIRQADFIRQRIPRDHYDLAIGNPPFASTPIEADPDYPQGFMLHDYFFAKTLDAVRPGGVLMFVTSAGTMNKLNAAARDYLADRADLVGAIRLPSSAFKDFAGTEVTTDVVVLRKRLEGEAEADSSWRQSTTIDLPNKEGGTGQGAVNQYFVDNPNMILGEQGVFDTLQPNRVVVRPDGRDLAAAFREAASALPQDVMIDADPATELEVGDADGPEWKPGSYYLKDGRLYQYDGESAVGREVKTKRKGQEGGIAKAAHERIKALVPVKMALREVYSADVNGRDASAPRKSLNEAYDAFVAKYGPINKLDRQTRAPSRVQVEGQRQRAFDEARNAGEPFDMGSFDPAPMMAEGKSLSEIARARAKAMEDPNYREGDFDPAAVPPNVIEKRPNIDPFMDDQEGYRLRAIENYDRDTGEASKGRVFTENAITVSQKPRIEGAGDALTYTMAQTGRVDLARIADLAGMDQATALEEIRDQVFRNPVTGEYETRAKYLSGNIYRKIEEAEKASDRDPTMASNIEALRSVLPDPLGPDEITAKMGANWIPAEDYAAWAKSKGLRLDVRFEPTIGAWSVDGSKSGAKAISDFGTDDMPFGEIISKMMNGRQIVVKKKPDRDSAPVVFAEETEAANAKARELADDFNRWVWEDPARSQILQDKYNRLFNAEVAPQYDGAYLTTPGVHSDWRWRPHQTSVIARILQHGSTYMAHAVGSGKTSAMIGAVMEGRRLGLVKKPMISVPNHMLSQFATEFYEQYPLAKIAIADEARFHTSRRKQFIADIQANDYDAVILTHSALKLVPVSAGAKSRILGGMVEDLRTALEDMGDERDQQMDQAMLGAARSVASTLGVDTAEITEEKGVSTRKKLEQMLEAAEQKIEGDATIRGQDAVADFDELGVDQLYVDEAHNYRKLSFPTQMSATKGVDGEGSASAMDLFVKSRLTDERNPGRGLVLASGTPVTNTMGELYTVSRFMQPDALEERGIKSFDAWASTFGQTTTALEQQPAGGFKDVSRFAKFVNVPELSVMVRQRMDVVTSADLAQYVTRPALKGGQRNVVVVPRSDEVAEIQSDLAMRLEKMKTLKPEERVGKYHHFSITNDGRMGAIDPRLVNPDYSGRGSKLNAAIRNIHRVWRDGAESPLHGVKEGGGYTDDAITYGPTTQIVFSTLGINGSQDNRSFRVHRHIKSELVRMGVPAGEIILQEDLKTDTLKYRAFGDMNDGSRRILIGGANLFTGVNAQKRMAAIHNLDPLWFPADDEQRNGRGIRQGNMNPEIEVFDYSTQDTYDATMWQLMGRKAAFIEGFFRGDPNLRDMEDLGEASAYEQAMAMSISDHRVFELQEWRGEQEKLQRQKSAVSRSKAARQRDAQYYGKEAERVREKADALARVAKKTPSTRGNAFAMTVGADSFEKRKDAGRALFDRLGELIEAGGGTGWVKAGEIAGWDVEIMPRLSDRSGSFRVTHPDAPSEGRDNDWSDDPTVLIRRVEDVPNTAADRAENLKALADDHRSKAEDARDAADRIKPFQEDERLTELTSKIDEMETTLRAETEGPEDGQEMREEDVDARLTEDPTEAASETSPDPALEGGANDQSAEVTDDDIKAIEAEASDRLRALGLSRNVSLRVIRGLAGRGWLGRYRAGGIGLRVAGNPDWRGTLDHEVIHALRDADLWGRPHGLFDEREWRSLVRAARADEGIRTRVDRDYADRPARERTEEMVAELYRQWAGGAERSGAVQTALRRARDFFEAIASGLTGNGFLSAADVMRRVADGGAGGRSQARDGAGRFTSPAREQREATADIEEFTPAERSRVSQLLTDAMGGQFGLLSLVPGRPLFAELGRAVPAAQQYLRLKMSMDTERQDWHAKTDEVAQKWRKLIGKHGEANKRLMTIMHRATIHQVDPTRPFDRHATPQDPEIVRTHTGYAKEQAEKRIASDRARKRMYGRLTKEFEDLPAEMRQMFEEVRDAYTELADAFDEVILDNVSKSADIALKRAERTYESEMQRIRDAGTTGLERTESEQAAEEKIERAREAHRRNKASRVANLRAAFETNRLQGPYFPLGRYGRYFATVRDKEGNLLSFSRFEKEREQSEFAKEARAVEGQDVTIGVIDDSAAMRKQVDPSFVAEVEGIIGNANVDEATMDAVWQRWLATLPDMSLRTSRIHRRNVEGYDDDAFRAFGKAMFHGSHQHARLKYSTDMEEALEVAGEQAARTDDPNRSGMLVNEMERRHEFTMNPTGTSWAQFATSAAFVYYLGVTPAAAIVNLSQTTVVGIPILTAGFRKATIAQSTKQLGRALRDFTGGKGYAEQSSRLSRLEKEAMREAYNRGTVDRTQSHDLAGVAETGVEYSATRVKVMGYISAFFHHAERLNREVTFLAAYRMAKAHGAGHVDAIDKASDLTWKTHFDYQNSSRPRLLQNDPAKVLLVFRNFQINMLYRLFRDTHQAFKGKSAEERREARVQLGGITAMMLAHAGITGTWGYALTTALLGMFFDDGSDDVERELQRGLVNIFGPNLAGMMMKGVPGHLTQADLTARLGMPELWFRSSDRQLEGDDVYNYWLAEMVGPVPGMAENAIRGVQKLGQGDIWRGIETASPKFVRDLMQSARYAMDGVQTYNGDPVVDQLSPYQVLIEAMGFSPAEVSEAYDRNTMLKNQENRIMDARSRLHRKAADDIEKKGRITGKTLQAIRRFNAENPTYPVSGDTIRRSMGSRLRMSNRNQGGVSLNPRLNDTLRRNQAPGLYTD